MPAPTYLSAGTYTSSASSGSTSITVHADTTLLVVGVSFWDNGGQVSSITIGGDSMTRLGGIWNTGADHAEIWVRANPSTGSQTLAYTHGAGAFTEGAVFTFACLQDAGATPTDIDTDFNAAEDGAISITLTSSVDDLVVAIGAGYTGFGAGIDLAQTGQTVRANTTNNDTRGQLATEPGAASVTVTSAATDDYAGAVAASFPYEAPGGGGVSIPVVMAHRRMTGQS